VSIGILQVVVGILGIGVGVVIADYSLSLVFRWIDWMMRS